MTSRRHSDVSNVVITKRRTMENTRILFSRVMPKELQEKWRQESIKRPIFRTYLPLEGPDKVIKGHMHQRFWDTPTLSMSMALAAINWWNFAGKKKRFTKEALNSIISHGHGLDFNARYGKSESELSRGPSLHVSIREQPWHLMCATSDYYTISTWQIKVQLGRSNGGGDMENLTRFLESFADQPFGITVTIGKHAYAVCYNTKKEWIVVDFYGELEFLDHTVPAVSAWTFNKPRSVEAFLASIRTHDGSCLVSKPVFPNKKVASNYKVKLDLMLRFGDKRKPESQPSLDSISSYTTTSLASISSYSTYTEQEDEESYVCFMGGFGGY